LAFDEQHDLSTIQSLRKVRGEDDKKFEGFAVGGRVDAVERFGL
jgi:hypothetical protein